MFSVIVSTFVWIWSTFEFRLRAILEIQEMFYKVSKLDAIFSSGRIWTYLCLCLSISRLTVEKLLTTLWICTSYWEIIIDARFFFYSNNIHFCNLANTLSKIMILSYEDDVGLPIAECQMMAAWCLGPGVTVDWFVVFFHWCL